MKLKTLIAAPLIAVALAGCGGNDEREGSPAVYALIEGMDSCANLQAEFDKAMGHAEARSPGDPLRAISLSYADAAVQRMAEVGCD